MSLFDRDATSSERSGCGVCGEPGMLALDGDKARERGSGIVDIELSSSL